MSNGFQAYNASLPEPNSLDQASSTGSHDGESSRARSIDPAGSSFFSGDFKKHDDLRGMLESSKDAQKLEAMRRIINMVAKGKDCSDLFPSVVKNVVAKNSEVKKLVYVYLTRYAEEKQDLALLSISTFQRALKDPNQLIRASALRVLTSIRVPVILQIQTLALRDAVVDMSAYVRKTAALAIPKIYSLDPESKPQLIEVIEKLLGDKTTLVVGVAIQAFEEVCPDRIDLIHKNYRKLCELLADVQDWGQVVIINMLTRYVRSQFLDPNQPEQQQLDPDHELLLKIVRPLFQSQNAAVVMAVAQLYHHCAPPAHMGLVVRHLVRLLRASPEVQSCALASLASLSVSSPSLFSSHLKNFYIRSTDSSSVKLVKLEILTNLATDSNISVLLRELQAYVASPDSELASAAVQAIGRCASQLPETTDTCLSGLVTLLSKKDESVVAEAIVVIKKLLQMQTSDHSQMIVHLARLVDKIAIPRARASILWLIGEYCDRIPKIAPDVLRKFAKSFLEEEDQVKLQIVNLAAKLCVCNHKQTHLLAQYVLNLAKYDQNYDIRDRSRFLRPLVFPGEQPGLLSKHVKKILLAPKPAPESQGRYADNSPFQLGSLSHLLRHQVSGYQPLPEWPEEQPDPSVRIVQSPQHMPEPIYRLQQTPSASSESSGSESDSDSSSSDEGAEDTDKGKKKSDSGSASSSSSSSSEDEDDDGDKDQKAIAKKQEAPKLPTTKAPAAAPAKGGRPRLSTTDTQQTSPVSSSDDDDDDSSATASSTEDEKQKKPKRPAASSSKKSAPAAKESASLLDFDEPTPSQDQQKQPSASSDPFGLLPDDLLLLPTPSKSYSLVNKYSGNGLELNYSFPRTFLSSSRIPVTLSLTNHSSAAMSDIRLQRVSGPEAQLPEPIAQLQPGASTTAVAEISWTKSASACQLRIGWDQGQECRASIQPPVGELLTYVTMSAGQFATDVAKLTGMHEVKGKLPAPVTDLSDSALTEKVQRSANVVCVPSGEAGQLCFAARTCGSEPATVYLVVDRTAGQLRVHCGQMALGSVLHREITNALAAL